MRRLVDHASLQLFAAHTLVVGTSLPPRVLEDIELTLAEVGTLIITPSTLRT